MDFYSKIEKVVESGAGFAGTDVKCVITKNHFNETMFVFTKLGFGKIIYVLHDERLGDLRDIIWKFQDDGLKNIDAWIPADGELIFDEYFQQPLSCLPTHFFIVNDGTKTRKFVQSAGSGGVLTLFRAYTEFKSWDDIDASPMWHVEEFETYGQFLFRNLADVAVQATRLRQMRGAKLDERFTGDAAKWCETISSLLYDKKTRFNWLSEGVFREFSDDEWTVLTKSLSAKEKDVFSALALLAEITGMDEYYRKKFGIQKKTSL